MICNNIGSRITALREERRLTQKELAENLNVKRETVNQWENGTRDLKTDYTVKLADFFGVTCDYLLRGIKSENVSINARLGLNDETIKNLEAVKGNKFSALAIKYISSPKTRFLDLLAEYLFSFVYEEIQNSDYKLIPLKANYSKNNKISFANIIEILPLFRARLKQIYSGTDEMKELIMAFLASNANIDEVNYIRYSSRNKVEVKKYPHTLGKGHGDRCYIG